LPGGVRGYRDSRVVGAVRGVARVEERWSFGRLNRHVGLGLASFADAGMVWAGAAPFGVKSDVKVGVGAGLLVAVPPQSKRLWRLDFAVPVSPDAHAGWEVRLTTVRVGGFWSEPGDVARLRAGAAPSLIFTWP
jgi:hemolysin activation/secretion protein